MVLWFKPILINKSDASNKQRKMIQKIFKSLFFLKMNSTPTTLGLFKEGYVPNKSKVTPVFKM
jgi:hypothetical protein